MPDTPENSTHTETPPMPDDLESASGANSSDFAKRLGKSQGETPYHLNFIKLSLFASGIAFIMLFLFCFLFGLHFEDMSLLLQILLLFSGCIFCMGVMLDGLILQRSAKQIHVDYDISMKKTVVEFIQWLPAEQLETWPKRLRIAYNNYLREILHSAQYTSANVDFCLAWLKMLQNIGTMQDYRLIKRLVTTRLKVPIERSILDAALECLPHIEARIAAQKQNSTLLRASAPEADGGKTLLRPAGNSSATPPNELLRPSELEGDAKDSEG